MNVISNTNYRIISADEEGGLHTTHVMSSDPNILARMREPEWLVAARVCFGQFGCKIVSVQIMEETVIELDLHLATVSAPLTVIGPAIVRVRRGIRIRAEPAIPLPCLDEGGGGVGSGTGEGGAVAIA